MSTRSIFCRSFLECQRIIPCQNFLRPKLVVKQNHLATSITKTNRFSTNQPFKTATFDDIQQLIKSNNKNNIILDVREYSEVEQGYIPKAKNVPLTQFGHAWELSEEDFRANYGFDKPKQNDRMVAYCLKGIRSAMAVDYLSEIGYTNVENYLGSYDDYLTKSKEKII